MPSSPLDAFGELMFVIRSRFDAIKNTKETVKDRFTRAETCAFHGRKIIEGIAFGCLIALENSLNHIPRDTKGQWKAGAIFDSLDKKNLGSAFPSPSIVRSATPEEAKQNQVQHVIEGQPERRLTKDELKDIYERMHRWNHEINPYVTESRSEFLNTNEADLWNDLDRLWSFIEKYFIAIGGKGFLCILKNDVDGQVKVLPLQK